MNRSSIIAILAVLVIACVAGFLFFGGSFGGDVIKVGSTEFKAPEGYHQGAPNKLGHVSMSNGTNEIYLTELNGTDVNVHIKGYQDYIKTQNQTIKVSNNITCNVLENRTFGSGLSNILHIENVEVISTDIDPIFFS